MYITSEIGISQYHHITTSVQYKDAKIQSTKIMLTF